MILEQFPFIVHSSPVLIIVVPLMFALLTPVVGLIRREWTFPWMILALVFATLFSVTALQDVMRNGVVHYRMGNWAPPWGIEYVVDYLNGLMLVLVSGTSLLVAVYGKKSVEQELPGKEVYFRCIFLLQVTGFLGIVVTGDAFNLYVFLEIASLAGYALIAAGEEGAPFASFRYVIMGTVGACFYLLAIGYLYIVTGSLNMADLARLLPPLYGSKVVLTAFAFFMVGIAIKMALFPLHVWLPDAYTKAPSAVSALVAPLMTKVSIYVMIRIMFTVFQPYFSIEFLPITKIMLVAGIVAIFAGAVMALAQKDFKRMLCYIIVAEVGYMVGGVGLANTVALRGTVLHIANDVVMTTGLFAVAGIIAYKMREHRLSDFKDLFKSMPVTMAAFVVIALSIIGVPPTGGFFSKWYLIQGALQAGSWLFVVALLSSSLINIVLFFRIFEIGYGFHSAHGHHGEGGEEVVAVREAPLSMLLPLIVTAAAIVILGFYNQAIIGNIIQYAVPVL